MAQQDCSAPVSTRCPTPDTFDAAAEAAVVSFDADIKRAARRAAARYGGGDASADDFAQEARIRLWRVIRRHGPKPERYVRRLIKRAIVRAAMSEMRGLGPLSPNRLDLDDGGVDQVAADHPPTDTAQAIRAWRGTLPPKQKELVRLIYSEERSQREAAALLDVSQPRIAQLHLQILAQARKDLALAA